MHCDEERSFYYIEAKADLPPNRIESERLNVQAQLEEPLNSDLANNGRRILIVDDDEDFANALQDLLNIEGYETQTAYSANDAIGAIESFDAEVAILDYRLGADDGLSLVEPLKRRNENLVCILTTADTKIDTVIKSLRYGVADYLRKPIHENELFLTLDRCFETIGYEEEKRIAEEKLKDAERMESVAHVAGGVAHHFNNLLMVVQWKIEALSELMVSDPEAGSLFQEIHACTERLTQINKDLLAYTGQQWLNPVTIDLLQLIESVLGDLPQDLSGAFKIELERSGSDFSTVVDATQMKKVVLELLRNAQVLFCLLTFVEF